MYLDTKVAKNESVNANSFQASNDVMQSHICSKTGIHSQIYKIMIRFYQKIRRGHVLCFLLSSV